MAFRRSMEFYPGSQTGEIPNRGLSELTELVKQVRNRCDISILLLRGHYCEESIEPLLPTLIEDIYEDVQAMVDGYCVEHGSS